MLILLEAGPCFVPFFVAILFLHSPGCPVPIIACNFLRFWVLSQGSLVFTSSGRAGGGVCTGCNAGLGYYLLKPIFLLPILGLLRFVGCCPFRVESCFTGKKGLFE